MQQSTPEPAKLMLAGVFNARAQVINADHLTFPDAAFDAITCAFSFFFLFSST